VCIKLVIVEAYTKMHGQQNIKKKFVTIHQLSGHNVPEDLSRCTLCIHNPNKTHTHTHTNTPSIQICISMHLVREPNTDTLVCKVNYPRLQTVFTFQK